MITKENTGQVFQKVISFLATTAKATGPNDFGTVITNHPFVCARGYVRPLPGVHRDVRVMANEIIVCFAHTAWDDRASRVCRMHPVVDDGQLAAYALGGDDAVCTAPATKDAMGFSMEAYHLWRATVEAFTSAVVQYDNRVAEDGALLQVDTGTPLGAFSVRIRPERKRKTR